MDLMSLNLKSLHLSVFRLIVMHNLQGVHCVHGNVPLRCLFFVKGITISLNARNFRDLTSSTVLWLLSYFWVKVATFFLIENGIIYQRTSQWPVLFLFSTFRIIFFFFCCIDHIDWLNILCCIHYIDWLNILFLLVVVHLYHSP